MHPVAQIFVRWCTRVDWWTVDLVRAFAGELPAGDFVVAFELWRHISHHALGVVLLPGLRTPPLLEILLKAESIGAVPQLLTYLETEFPRRRRDAEACVFPNVPRAPHQLEIIGDLLDNRAWVDSLLSRRRAPRPAAGDRAVVISQTDYEHILAQRVAIIHALTSSHSAGWISDRARRMAARTEGLGAEPRSGLAFWLTRRIINILTIKQDPLLFTLGHWVADCVLTAANFDQAALRTVEAAWLPTKARVVEGTQSSEADDQIVSDGGSSSSDWDRDDFDDDGGEEGSEDDYEMRPVVRPFPPIGIHRPSKPGRTDRRTVAAPVFPFSMPSTSPVELASTLKCTELLKFYVQVCALARDLNEHLPLALWHHILQFDSDLWLTLVSKGYTKSAKKSWLALAVPSIESMRLIGFGSKADPEAVRLAVEAKAYDAVEFFVLQGVDFGRLVEGEVSTVPRCALATAIMMTDSIDEVLLTRMTKMSSIASAEWLAQLAAQHRSLWYLDWFTQTYGVRFSDGVCPRLRSGLPPEMTGPSTLVQICARNDVTILGYVICRLQQQECLQVELIKTYYDVLSIADELWALIEISAGLDPSVSRHEQLDQLIKTLML